MTKLNRLARDHFNSAGLPKKAYLSLEDAEDAAARVHYDNGSSEERPYHAYRCSCQAWHIGRAKT